jgi:hypothetical protein
VICNTYVQGKYKFKVYHADGTLKLETPWFDNLITNNGMNLLASTISLTPNCYIGSGTTTPSVTDTQLANILHTANSVSSPIYTFFDGDEPYWRAYKIFTFNAGNATGSIREVGVGISPTNLFSRTLVQGVEEIPITIVVLADEKLEVYYERRNYLDKSDQYSPFHMASGLTNSIYDAQIRASNIGSVPDILSGFGPTRLNDVSFTLSGQKFLGTVYEPISGASVAASISSAAAYIADSHYIDYSFQFNPTVANFTDGVGTGTFQTTQSRFKFLLSPYVPKNSSYRLRFNIRHTWSRYIPAL